MEIQSTVRGHHIYKDIWTPVIGEELTVIPEENNEHDPHERDTWPERGSGADTIQGRVLFHCNWLAMRAQFEGGHYSMCGY